jgi:hypothetical protein
MSSNLPII